MYILEYTLATSGGKRVYGVDHARRIRALVLVLLSLVATGITAGREDGAGIAPPEG